MNEDKPDLESISRLPARELFRLSLPVLNLLIREATEEARKAKRREQWLRKARAEKLRREASAKRGEE